jgi:hypothetical protein
MAIITEVKATALVLGWNVASVNPYIALTTGGISREWL